MKRDTWVYYRLCDAGGHVVGYRRTHPLTMRDQWWALRTGCWQTRKIPSDSVVQLAARPTGLAYLGNPE